MLRHFLNATACTSFRSLFAKPTAPVYVSSSRSLFAKPNPPFSGDHLFSSTARTSFRSLCVKPNARVYASSLRLQSWQNHAVCLLLIAVIFVPSFFFMSRQASCKGHRCCLSREVDEEDMIQLTSIVPLATKKPDLREWTKANMEFKTTIGRHGSGMPANTFFWLKSIVPAESMPKLKNILADLKSHGARVEETENYYFLEANSQWKKERFLELMIWLEDPNHKFFRVPQTGRTDSSCYEGV